MKTTMIELISDDELIDLLVDTAHEVSESNFLAMVRDELKTRLTKPALDLRDAQRERAVFLAGGDCAVMFYREERASQ